MNWILKSYDELTKEELYRIIKLRLEVFVVEQNCIYADLDGKDINAYHLYTEEKGRITGYLRILKPGISYKEASIGRVLTHGEYRRIGLGKALMNRGIDFIEKELKEDKIRISAQKYLLNFYQDLGFKVVSEEYLEDDIPHFEMLYTKKGYQD